MNLKIKKEFRFWNSFFYDTDVSGANLKFL